MQRFYKTGLLAAVLACLIVLSGCTATISSHDTTIKPDYTDTKTEDSKVLTERQIRILSEEGLPTDYDMLSESQKSAINAIEDLLSYLESRYSDQFEYIGYVPCSALEEEHLIASSAAEPYAGEVTVYRGYVDGKYVYEDNYSSLIAKSYYENAIFERLSEEIDADTMIVVSEISNADLDVNETDVISQASAASYVFVLAEACTEGELASVVENYGAWIKEQSNGKQSNVTMFYLVPSELFFGIDEFNYHSLFPTLQKSVYYSCSLSQQGILKIYKGGE